MKTKRFIKEMEAVRYAHQCQQGGYDVSLIVKPTCFIVCKRIEAWQYSGANNFTEHMKGAIDYVK